MDFLIQSNTGLLTGLQGSQAPVLLWLFWFRRLEFPLLRMPSLQSMQFSALFSMHSVVMFQRVWTLKMWTDLLLKQKMTFSGNEWESRTRGFCAWGIKRKPSIRALQCDLEMRNIFIGKWSFYAWKTLIFREAQKSFFKVWEKVIFMK